MTSNTWMSWSEATVEPGRTRGDSKGVGIHLTRLGLPRACGAQAIWNYSGESGPICESSHVYRGFRRFTIPREICLTRKSDWPNRATPWT